MDLSRYLPSLLEYYPNEGSSNVPTSGLTITLRFSTALDTSISGDIQAYFSLTQLGAAQSVPLQFVAFEDSYKTIKVSPAGALLPDTYYVFVVSHTLPSSRGRQSGVTRSFSFRTTSTPLGVPRTTSPAEAAVVQLPISFDWTIEDYTGPGRVIYQLQLAEDERFASIIYNQQVSGHPVTVHPPSVVVGRQYWWRVRGLVVDGDDVIVTGSWSNISSFLCGPVTGLSTYDIELFPSQAPAVTWLYDVDGDGLFNLPTWPALHFLVRPMEQQASQALLTAWQWMGFYFVTSGSQNILYRFAYRYVDGYPSADWIPDSGTVSVPVPGLVVFEPDDPQPKPNCVYRFSLAVDDGEIYHFTWTSHYRPMYVTYDIISHNIGPEVEQYLGKESVYLHIYRTSLDANRHWIRWFGMPPWLGGPSEAQVRSLTVVPTYAMERWCEAEATARILQTALHAMLRDLGSSHRLGDYQESHDADFIRELRALVREYRREAEKWLAEFSKKRSPVVASRYRVAFPQSVERNTDWSGGVPGTRDFR